MKFYNIQDDYIRFLKSKEDKVSDNKEEKRPYVGIVLEIQGLKYYSPFSSPKEKHRNMKNSKDFRKINKGIYGAINFNNMIPVVDEVIISIDVNKITDVKYRRLLQNQYNCIKEDKEQIKNTANALYTLVMTEDEKLNRNDLKIKKRCCNFKMLEEICNEYINTKLAKEEVAATIIEIDDGQAVEKKEEK